MFYVTNTHCSDHKQTFNVFYESKRVKSFDEAHVNFCELIVLHLIDFNII